MYCAGGAGQRGGGIGGGVECELWGLGFKVMVGLVCSQERRGAVSEDMSGDVCAKFWRLWSGWRGRWRG